MTLDPATFDKREAEARKKLTAPVLLSWIFRFCPCAQCGCSLEGGFDDDHIKPLWGGGTNAPDNRQPLCRPCHKIKTAHEAAQRAEGNRKAGRTGQHARRKRNGGTKMQGRGFQAPPPGHNAWGKGRKLGQRYKSNTRVDG